MQRLKTLYKWLGIVMILSFSTTTSAQNLIGKQVPPLVVENQQQTNVSLNDLKGKFVLLNFWGSWCPESVLKLPTLNNIKQQNSDTNPGFEVFNVALDDDMNAWLKACHENNQSGTYQCVAKGKFESYCAYDFGIDKLPTSFLISPDGIVLEQNPTVAQIESYLTKGATSSDQAYTTYKVLLGTFGSIDFHNAFLHLSHLGPINPNETEDKEYIVWIGPFTDFTSAQYAEQEVKKRGYVDAMLITATDDIYTPPIFVDTPPLDSNGSSGVIKEQNNDVIAINNQPPNTNKSTTANSVTFTPPVPVKIPTPTIATNNEESATPKDNDFVIVPSKNSTPSVIVTNLPDKTDTAKTTWDMPVMLIPSSKTVQEYNPYKDDDDLSSRSLIFNYPNKNVYNPYEDIAKNPKVLNKINKLEKRKKIHSDKVQKIDAKISDIGQREFMKNAYKKNKK